MLKSWCIQNFKPILDSGELKLAPVTVLAGRNSSGKSSLIQSILMIEQTLSNRVLDRALLPNGPIVQLGTFEDILSEQTDLRTLVVGFELEIEKEKLKASAGTRVRLVDGRPVAVAGTNIKSIKVISQFRSASSDSTSTSAIEASKVSVESVSLDLVALRYNKQRLPVSSEEEIGTLFEFGIDIKLLSPMEFDVFLKDVLPEYLRLVTYSAKESNYLGAFRLKEALNNIRIPTPSLVTFSHFLPARLIGKYVVEERRWSRLRRTLSMAFEYSDDRFVASSEIGSPEFLLPDSLRDAVVSLCRAENISDVFSGRTFLELIRWYNRLLIRGQKRKIVGNKLKEVVDQNNLAKMLQADMSNSERTEALETVTNNAFVENLEDGVEQIIQFFTSKIRYLGPLRADPQAAQKFAPSSELDDIGAKGEYAAAVYEANQNAGIRWYNPSSSEIERSTLKIALNTWASYLGVANEINIQMAGQSGVSWQIVHIEGHKALPLTAVGVGVSQILPILVMGLLSPANTLLLVEQPELHLHPRVQARLGDFFMGLAQCGKQCLIETHSENLISQLRYHIVQAGGQEKSDCLIYFVDQDEQGAAQFNPIEISADGNILNWPDGFFDETMLQEDRITAASLKKRAQKTKNG